MNKEYWKDKRVFITGHSGFKGTWLCILLRRAGAEVFGYSKSSNPTDPSLFELCKDLEVTSTWGDINDSKTLQEAMAQARPSHVIHMAAQTIVKDGFTNPKQTFETNTIGTLSLLEACRENPVVKNILVVTTDKVYGEATSFWGYREVDPMRAADPYSTSKACAELVTQCYFDSFLKKFNTHLASARAGNVVGGGDFAYRLIPMTMEFLMKGDKPPIWDPTAIRPWQSVLDCLNGYLTLLEYISSKDISYIGAYNFGPPENECLEVGMVIDKLCELWSGGSVKWEKVQCPVKYNLGVNLLLNPQKANFMLGWYPKWNLGRTLTELVQWYKEYEKGEDVRGICERTIDRYETC